MSARPSRGLSLPLALALAALALPCGSALAQPKPGEAVPEEKLKEAREHMAAGSAFYNDPSGHKCEEAIREFKKAFELSGSANAAKGVAVCALELERDGEALQYYEQYLSRPKKDPNPEEVAQAERDVKALKAAVSWITVKANVEGVRLTDTRTPSRGSPVINRYVIGKDPVKLGIHPGDHQFVATLDGMADVTWKLEIVNGTTHQKTFEMTKAVSNVPPPPQEKEVVERPIPVYAWVVGGIAVASAGAWIGTMVWASGEKSNYDKVNGTVSVDEATKLRNNVQTANLVADVMLGVTGAAVVGTIVVFAVRPEVKVKKAAAVEVLPAVGPGGGGVFLSGKF